MAKTNFESLRVYQLSESLADQIWTIVLTWNVFARDTVGKQIVKAADTALVKAGVQTASVDEQGDPTLEADNRRFGTKAQCLSQVYWQVAGTTREQLTTDHWRLTTDQSL